MRKTHIIICVKSGEFSRNAQGAYIKIQNYRVPWDVVDMAVAGALEHQDNDILVWYTSEDPDILRYWVIGAIMEHAQPLVL